MKKDRSSSATRNFIETECTVIGGGLAGCTAALELADAGKHVDLFVKEKLIKDSNSYYIAGGLAAVPLTQGKPIEGDSYKSHIRETLEAGKGLNDPSVTEFCIKRFFPDVIEWLINKGVPFDSSPKFYPYHLHKEGGHSRNRIFHVQDKTGIAIMEILSKRVRHHPNIKVHEDHVAIDLITRNKVEHYGQEPVAPSVSAEPRRSSSPPSFATNFGETPATCSKDLIPPRPEGHDLLRRRVKHIRGRDICLGAYIYDVQSDCVQTVSSQGLFIATGGLGKVFLYTTNPDVATGDGFAICYRAGLPLVNMEFIQFHPSVFYDSKAAHENERRFLLTEALRGAGAILKLNPDDKKDFVLKYHPLGSSATRDIVARAEDMEMRKNGLKHLWLDCTRIPKTKLKRDFKNTYHYCLSKGIDMARESVPIIYAVHYSNGGVLVGRHGETTLRNCYVLGETSYTGLHGATRLASNSAPECVLFSRLAARHFLMRPHIPQSMSVPRWKVGRAKSLRDRATVAYYWDTVRRTMSGLCGISRNAERLHAAKQVLSSIRESIHDFYWNYRVSKDFLEVRNIADVALIIIESALAREESRACHFREDFPRTNPKYRSLTIVQKNKPVQLKKVPLTNKVL